MKGQDIGKYGGQVLRKLSLFGIPRSRGVVLEAEEVKKLSIRHVIALQSGGFIKFFNGPNEDLLVNNNQETEKTSKINSSKVGVGDSKATPTQKKKSASKNKQTKNRRNRK